jgi:SAM-dependent methyltransferase
MLSDRAIMLLGFQRTKQISRKARLAWMSGDEQPLKSEVAERRDAIFAGAIAETFPEYLPLRNALRERNTTPATVVDIGCGQGLTDAYLAQDFDPAFILVDIEETEEQYHFWADEGAGYASLEQAVAFLAGNGVAPDRIIAINPRKTPDAISDVKGDLVTSWYSCGFHYPVDDYLDVFLTTLADGGIVALDLRKRYLRKRPPALSRLLDAATVTTLYNDTKSTRVMLEQQ